MANFERKSKQTTKNQIFRAEEHEKLSQHLIMKSEENC